MVHRLTILTYLKESIVWCISFGIWFSLTALASGRPGLPPEIQREYWWCLHMVICWQYRYTAYLIAGQYNLEEPAKPTQLCSKSEEQVNTKSVPYFMNKWINVFICKFTEEQCLKRPKELIRPGRRLKLMPRIEWDRGFLWKPYVPQRDGMLHIQGVTGGTDQTSGECSLC